MYTIPGNDGVWKGIFIIGASLGMSLMALANEPKKQLSTAKNENARVNPVSDTHRESKLQIQYYHSPNYSKGRTQPINLIVLHTTEGSGEGAKAWLTNPESKASAHYLITEKADIVQLVEEENKAWHCRNYNDVSIGIEIAGFYDQDLREQQIMKTTTLIKDIQRRRGNLQIKPHSELDPARRKDPGKKNLERILYALKH